MNGNLDLDHSDEQTMYLPVAGSDKVWKGHENDDEDNAEDKYELLRKKSWKTLLTDYCALMKGEKRKLGDVNGIYNDVEQVCGNETEVQEEEFDSTVILIARLDVWIFSFLLCMVSWKSHGVKRQKI